MIREANKELRDGGFVLLRFGVKAFVLGDVRNSEGYARLMESRKDKVEFKELLFPDLGWLQDHVAKVPDLAWDVLEFTEKPLSMGMPGAKNVPEGFEESEGVVNVRICKKGEIHRLIFNHGRALFCIHLPWSDDLPSALAKEKKSVTLQAVEVGFSPEPKKMFLGLDGEVKFQGA